MEFIDTHNHILPAVDDGAPDATASIEMAKIAVADGISTIVATPHVVEGMFDSLDLDARIASLQLKLDERGISVRLVKGAEVPISLCLSGEKTLLADLAVSGRYLLMESAETSFDQLIRAVYQVRLCGLSPVLAHPERTSYARKDLDRLEAMVLHDDVFCQLTVASLEGLFGPQVRRTSAAMANRGIVHLLASDAHSTKKRVPRLSGGYRELARIVGEEAAMTAVFVNPRRMIQGETLRIVGTAQGNGRSGYLKRLLGRG